MLLNFHSLLLNTFVYERIKRINTKKRKRENRRKVDKKEKNQKKELIKKNKESTLDIISLVEQQFTTR